MKTIIFDMDGTLVDLYGVENWSSMLRAENPTPYKEAPPLVNLTEFNVLCGLLKRKGYDLGVVSWLSKESSKAYKKAVRAAKRFSLREKFPSLDDNIHLVQYGTPKHYVVRAKGNILFDDDPKVGAAWKEAGGIWCDVKKEKIEKVLRQLLES